MSIQEKIEIRRKEEGLIKCGKREEQERLAAGGTEAEFRERKEEKKKLVAT